MIPYPLWSCEQTIDHDLLLGNASVSIERYDPIAEEWTVTVIYVGSTYDYWVICDECGTSPPQPL